MLIWFHKLQGRFQFCEELVKKKNTNYKYRIARAPSRKNPCKWEGRSKQALFIIDKSTSVMNMYYFYLKKKRWEKCIISSLHILIIFDVWKVLRTIMLCSQFSVRLTIITKWPAHEKCTPSFPLHPVVFYICNFVTKASGESHQLGSF